MADRIFASLALLVVLAYGFIAFTGIKAPFQYDPLGPESWPQLLSIAAGLCCLWILIKPDTSEFQIQQGTAIKVVIMLIALLAYAFLFERAGFIISTALYCAVSARLLGATNLFALLFGVATGVIAYFVGVKILDLNLPAGWLSALL